MNIKLLRIILLNILCLSLCTTVFGATYDEKCDNIISIIAPYISNYISTVHQDDGNYGVIKLDHAAPNTGTMIIGKYKHLDWNGE